MKYFGVSIAFLGVLLIVNACGESGPDNPIPVESGSEAAIEAAIPTQPVAVDICLPESERTDDLYAGDLGVYLFIDRVGPRKSDLPGLTVEGRGAGFYSRKELAKKYVYPLERLATLRGLGLLQEWRMDMVVDYTKPRRLANYWNDVYAVFGRLAAPDPPVIPNLKIELRIVFFNSDYCAQEYFRSEIVAGRLETKILTGFVADVAYYEGYSEEGRSATSAVVVPSSSFPAIITATSIYEAPAYLTQALDTLRNDGETEIAAYFESLDQDWAGYIDTEEFLEIIANRYWQQVSATP